MAQGGDFLNGDVSTLDTPWLNDLVQLSSLRMSRGLVGNVSMGLYSMMRILS